MLPAIIIICTLLTILATYKYNLLKNKLYNLQTIRNNQKSDESIITSNITHDRISEIEDRINDLPNKVLESINGSISNQKGKLAELIAYVNLKAGYDKVIPLGNIVDFIGIRFPTELDPGTFDFIDVKNGKSARLSEDQKQLQKLIKGQRIQFLKVKIITDNVADLPKDDNTGSNTEV